MVATERERKLVKPRERGTPIKLPRFRELLLNRNVHLATLALAALLLVLTMFLPYWHITLYAPQYPKGLTIDAYVNRLSGDVHEVDGLNHYIGMMKLNQAATFERTVSRFAIPLIAILTVASFWMRGRWKWLAITPILVYPFAFMIDLFAWLYHAGHTLDPHAALSNSIKPFTPHIFGVGRIGQFRTDADFAIGFYLALFAAALALAAIIAERKRERATN